MEEANKALKRQRQNIQELENEKTQMARSLKTSRSKQNKLKDEKNTDSVYQLIEGQDNLNVMIKVRNKKENPLKIVIPFINFILKQTEGDATVDFIITLFTSSINS